MRERAEDTMQPFDRSVCTDLTAATRREWLETNGLGGYASSTLAGLHTRRYHGLLVAATKPPVGRTVLVSKLEDAVTIDGLRYELSTNQYAETVHPRGFELLGEFRPDPLPTWVYDLHGFELVKTVFMIHGSNTTVVEYELKPKHDGPALAALECSLEVRPLLAMRDYHALAHEDDRASGAVSIEAGLVRTRPFEHAPEVYVCHDGATVDERAWWYRGLEYAEERARGFDSREDLFSPFALTFDLSKRRRASVVLSTAPHDAAHTRDDRRAEIKRREAITANVPIANDLVRSLVRATDHYIVGRDDSKTVIAGYHWFADWGRDTMISLPGLTIATGRPDVARQILLTFARHVDRGMLPNRFPDAGEAPEYNTVDSALWFFEAVRALAAKTGDYEFVREHLYEKLAEIVVWHERGTRYGIAVDTDGLVRSGEEGVQLTWMDAKVGDWVVTPRRGKPVEIQALWYNALRVMQDFAKRFGDTDGAAHYAAAAGRAHESFEAQFWNADLGCLYDVVDGAERDASIRPNQVLAVSLHYSMLSEERSRAVVDVVERELLTPVGLRSLAPGDPAYRPHYGGDSLSRDGAYHQGTVWGWLLGPFITAYVRVNGATPEARARGAELLEGLGAHLADAGIGHVSEIFDGDAPHEPRGCIAQAWSVAEALRAAVEDVYVGEQAARVTGRISRV
jgi:predicted glycogen debranching enzyme